MAHTLAAQVQQAFNECSEMARNKDSQRLRNFFYKFTDETGTHEIRIERADAEEEAKVVAAAMASLSIGRATAAAGSTASRPLLTTVSEKFRAENRRGWAEKTERDYGAIL